MLIKADLVDDVVLLIDEHFQVRDAFQVQGPTEHETSFPVAYYTYRSLLTLPGTCAVCGGDLEALNRPCSASGGFHAFVGLPNDTLVPTGHRAENRSLQLVRLDYDELAFFIENDNLFRIDQPAAPLQV